MRGLSWALRAQEEMQKEPGKRAGDTSEGLELGEQADDLWVWPHACPFSYQDLYCPCTPPRPWVPLSSAELAYTSVPHRCSMEHPCQLTSPWPQQ